MVSGRSVAARRRQQNIGNVSMANNYKADCPVGDLIDDMTNAIDYAIKTLIDPGYTH